MIAAALHNHLDDFPDDWDTRLVLADMLEEQGLDTQATVQRWMVQHQLRPYLWSEREHWCWFGPYYLPRGVYTVPLAVWKKMMDTTDLHYYYANYISFPSRQEAENRLIKVIAQREET